MPGKGTQLTGKLGDVIKESTTIALSFVRAHAHALGLADAVDKDITADLKLHLHMPEGATGKDGPSAGVAFVTAFVGLFAKRSIVDDLGAPTRALISRDNRS
jgi:Lon-like ATP-dependent protease